MLSHIRRRRLASLLPGVSLFLLSLFLVGFYVGDRSEAYFGFGILDFGWLGIFYWWPANLVWLANPLLIGAWLVMLRKESRSSIVLAILALAIGSAFLLCKSVEIDESGSLHPISGYGAGYWIWSLSMAGTALGSFVAIRYQ
ncbi:MAG TPA: hypothetical protein VN766_20885, partial [Stellaceae bacterium]|nr:hypothetical protein [Stellaceae bacterium]